MKDPAAVAAIISGLKAHYPDALCSLEYIKDYELLFSVRLAAQCTDERVNQVTPALFARYPTLESLAEADVHDIETYIHSTGFFRAKARDIVAASRMLLDEYGGKGPDTMEALLKLPGVGRKTANVVMCEAFKNPQGIAVDTHVFRIAHRLRFATRNDDTPAKTEAKLLKIYPQRDWLYINHQWVHFGRDFCRARNPRCLECPVKEFCPSCGKA